MLAHPSLRDLITGERAWDLRPPGGPSQTSDKGHSRNFVGTGAYALGAVALVTSGLAKRLLSAAAFGSFGRRARSGAPAELERLRAVVKLPFRPTTDRRMQDTPPYLAFRLMRPGDPQTARREPGGRLS
jgi:hypothetical protein